MEKTDLRDEGLGRRKNKPMNEKFAPYFAPEGEVKRPLSATVLKTHSEVSALLRNLENFPLFFENLEKIESLGENQTKWHFRGESNELLSIPMRMHFDSTDQGLIWQSEDAAGFKYSVAIQTEPAQANRGTIVRMMVAYDNLAGEIAGKFEKLFGKDALVLSKKNLQRFKAFCETGNVPTTAGQPSGREADKSTSMKH